MEEGTTETKDKDKVNKESKKRTPIARLLTQELRRRPRIINK